MSLAIQVMRLGLKVKKHSDTVSPVYAAAIYEYITYGIKPLALKEQEEKMDKLDDYIKKLDRAMPQFEVDDRLNECIKILSDLDEALDEFKNFDKMDGSIKLKRILSYQFQ